MRNLTMIETSSVAGGFNMFDDDKSPVDKTTERAMETIKGICETGTVHDFDITIHVGRRAGGGITSGLFDANGEGEATDTVEIKGTCTHKKKDDDKKKKKGN